MVFFTLIAALTSSLQLAFAAVLITLSRLLRSRVSGRPRRVAVIGGGIAGFGAAHSLCRSGVDVEIFEEYDRAGGNAKTHEWPDGAVTGLSVLAWPSYFRNYAALLRQLGLETAQVELPFYLRRADGESFVHGRSEALSVRYAADMRRWARLVALVRRVNRFFARSDTPSLYHFSLLNPMNVLPLRLLCWLCGISAGFWREVIVPLHCTTFLTSRLGLVPAVVVPTIDDIIPLAGIPRLSSWVGSSNGSSNGSSADVFERIAAAAPSLRVRTSCRVERVRRAPDGTWTVHVQPRDAASAPAACDGFDRVVFASSARHAAAALPATPLWYASRSQFTYDLGEVYL